VWVCNPRVVGFKRNTFMGDYWRITDIEPEVPA
jgi:hypothetical protein